MRVGRLWTLVLGGVVVAFVLGHPLWAKEEKTYAPSPGPPTPEESVSAPESFAGHRSIHGSIEAVVVNPYRSANVGTLVGGVVKRFHFEEGDFVPDGQVVAEIGPKRFLLSVARAEERLKSLQIALRLAEEEAKLREELFELDASTKQHVLKARAEAEIASCRVAEAQRELDLAREDLDSCKIRAPFSGHLAVKYKQADETVERLERVFAIVDSSQVHAVANVPENLLSELKKGSEAVFLYGANKRYSGIVDRIGKLIDPKSRTKRAYLLIDNSRGELEVGMTGSLQLVK
jgi:RND family efflux transporter MFP subunit